MRERVTESLSLSVLSVCLSLFYFGVGAFFRVILGDDLSPLNVALFENRAILEKKRAELRP